MDIRTVDRASDWKIIDDIRITQQQTISYNWSIYIEINNQIYVATFTVTDLKISIFVDRSKFGLIVDTLTHRLFFQEIKKQNVMNISTLTSFVRLLVSFYAELKSNAALFSPSPLAKKAKRLTNNSIWAINRDSVLK